MQLTRVNRRAWFESCHSTGWQQATFISVSHHHFPNSHRTVARTPVHLIMVFLRLCSPIALPSMQHLGDNAIADTQVWLVRTWYRAGNHKTKVCTSVDSTGKDSELWLVCPQCYQPMQGRCPLQLSTSQRWRQGVCPTEWGMFYVTNLVLWSKRTIRGTAKQNPDATVSCRIGWYDMQRRDSDKWKTRRSSHLISTVITVIIVTNVTDIQESRVHF